jgi:hypothetical protein
MNGGGNALYGSAWSSNVGNWPGVSGQQGITNHYSLNQYKGVDPQTSMRSERAIYKGGRKKQKGGLLDLGKYFVGKVYNGALGYPEPTNPLPYNQTKMQT